MADIAGKTRDWRQAAARAGISRADIELTAAAFAETDDYARHLSPATKQSHRQAPPGVNSPSPTERANNSMHGDELTKELDDSLDDDFDL